MFFIAVGISAGLSVLMAGTYITMMIIGWSEGQITISCKRLCNSAGAYLFLKKTAEKVRRRRRCAACGLEIMYRQDRLSRRISAWFHSAALHSSRLIFKEPWQITVSIVYCEKSERLIFQAAHNITFLSQFLNLQKFFRKALSARYFICIIITEEKNGLSVFWKPCFGHSKLDNPDEI